GRRAGVLRVPGRASPAGRPPAPRQAAPRCTAGPRPQRREVVLHRPALHAGGVEAAPVPLTPAGLRERVAEAASTWSARERRISPESTHPTAKTVLRGSHRLYVPGVLEQTPERMNPNRDRNPGRLRVCTCKHVRRPQKILRAPPHFIAGSLGMI